MSTIMFSKGGNVRITRSLSAIIAAILITAVPLASSAQVSVGIGVGFNIGTAPPPLPYYSVPPAPYPNYAWTPGYWAWGPAGYYWVPGVWVAPPSIGLYWTPGYWGYNNGYYGFNNGYWGSSVGFYGGINYGGGYGGTGFVGGYWSGNNFAYNTAVLPVNRTVIHNTYNRTIITKNVCNNCRNVSYNGGHGGITARPTPVQLQQRQHGRAPTTLQAQHARVASQDRALYASTNHGRPPVTALQKPVTDPKQLPNYAPVTAADKKAAQTQMKPGTVGAPAAKPAAQAPEKAKPMTGTHQNAPMTTTHHNAPVSQPAHKQPPSTMTGTHPQGQTHAKPPGGAMREPGTMHAQPGNAMGRPQGHPGGQGHPPGGQGHPPGGQGHPQGGQGHPQGGQGHPPSGQGKPPGGGGQKNKPPQ
jgi:hypothetical protein